MSVLAWLDTARSEPRNDQINQNINEVPNVDVATPILK